MDKKTESAGAIRARRELERIKPFFRREVVEEKVKALFPNHDSASILSLLDEYGTQSFQRDRERLQLHILKLSGGDLEQLRHHLDAAKFDYRDLIWSVETPEFMRVGIADWMKMPEPEKDQLAARDTDQYLEWLRGQ